MFRDDSNAVRTDVVDECFLLPIGTCTVNRIRKKGGDFEDVSSAIPSSWSVPNLREHPEACNGQHSNLMKQEFERKIHTTKERSRDQETFS